MFPEQNGVIYRFDEFTVEPLKRRLLRAGEPVAVNGKAFDLLLVLLERRGQVLSKDALMELVWPDQFVEEGNLPVHISTLRKALGERKDANRFIVTLPGRGYQFVADLHQPDVLQDVDVVIEQHTVSRITVEQEEDTDDQTLSASANAQLISTQAHGTSLQQRTTVKAATELQRWVRPVVVTVAILLASLIALAFSLSRFGSSQNRRVAIGPGSKSQRMANRQLTSVGSVASAALSPDGKYFGYVSTQDAKASLWLGHVNGGNPVQLRAPEAIFYGSLAFAPDGDSILYQQNGALFQIPVTGGAPQKLLERIPDNYSISSDGKYVGFVRADRDRKVSLLIIANIDGTGERELLALPTPQAFSSYGPAWAHDDTMLAIGASSPTNPNQYVLMSVQVADATMRQLSPQTWDSIDKIAWLQSGGIVFHARGPQSNFQIWQLDYPQENLHCITNDLNRYGRASVSVSADGDSLLAVRGMGLPGISSGPAVDLTKVRKISKESGGVGFSWTPDGKLVYAVFLNNSFALRTMNADGNDAKQITPSGFMDQFPAVTGDGRYVVFQSNRGGSGDSVWRVNPDGSDLRQLASAGQHPDVTPDGKWVLYTANENDTDSIWKISIDGGAAEQLTQSASDWPRVSPDGKLFACSHADDKAATQTQLAVFSLTDGRLLKHFDIPGTATLRNGIHWTHDGRAVVYRDFAGGLWRQPLTGAAAAKLAGVPNQRAYYFDWSRDGQQFAISYDEEIRDVVLLTNFK